MKKFFKIVLTIFMIGIMSTSLAFSVFAYKDVKEMNETVNFEEHIIAGFNKENGEIVSGERIAVSTDSVLNINIKDGKIFAENSKIILKGKSDIIVELPEKCFLEYSSNSESVKINKNIIIKNIDVELITENNISKFINEEGKNVIVGQQKIDEVSGVSIIVETNDESKEKDLEFVKNILTSISKYNNKNTISILGNSINNDWNNLLLTEDLLSINNRDNIIYIVPFDSKITGAGFDKKLEINEDFVLYYSDIKDSETGYIPYIIKTDNGNIKVLAQGNEIITNLFGIG